MGTNGGVVGHAFCCPGSYTVSATATDNFGMSSTASTQVVVGAMSVTIAPTGTTFTSGSPVTFTVTVSTGTVVSRYDWNFGDPGSAGNAATTTGNINSHQFTIGTHEVVVTVHGSNGSTGTGRLTIVVS